MPFDPRTRQLFTAHLDVQNASVVVVSCRDFDRYYGECQNRLLGWKMILPAASPLTVQARSSGRVYSERREGAQVELNFAAGQECFGHRVPTQAPRLVHFEGQTAFAAEIPGKPPVSSVTPIMQRNARPWQPQDWMEKFHEETDKREEALRREGLL